jgi:uncharacterized protein involved in exopolysaccharide biosynthesis
MLRKSPASDSEKALVLHSSAAVYRNQPPPPPAAPPHGVDLDLMDSLERHWRLSLFVFLLIAGFGTLWAYKTMKPVYQAETTIYIPPDMAREDSGDGVPASPYPTFVNQQIMSILHYDTLSDAIHQLANKGTPWRFPGENERNAVERLRKTLDVQRVVDSYEVSIQIVNSDPRMAAAIVNTVAASFLESGTRPDASGRSDRGSVLLIQKAALQKELQQQVELRSRLSESLQVVNLHQSTTLPDDEVLLQLRRSLTAAHAKRVEAEEHLQEGQSTVTSDAEQIANSNPASTAVTSTLLQRQFELRERIKSMTPSHPYRKQAEAELASIDAELQRGPGGDRIPKVTAQLMAKYKAQVEESRRVEADLTQEINAATANIPNMTRNLGQAEIVNADINRIQEHLTRVEGQLEEINLRNSTGGSMRVFSSAQPPEWPLKSQRMKALATVFAAALFLGLALPVGLDMLDMRIYDPASVEKILGFPVVGMTIARTPKIEAFADEHLRRLIAGIERGIAEGARTVLLTGLKQPVPPSLMRDIARQLGDHKINVTVRPGRRRLDTEYRQPNNQTRLIGPGVSLSEELEDCSVVLMDAPALVFSAETERLASEADMTLVVVQAGMNTRPDLVRGARLLERLNVPAIGVILQDVRVERAGRSLRRDLKEYMAMQRQLAGLTGTWVGW